MRRQVVVVAVVLLGLLPATAGASWRRTTCAYRPAFVVRLQTIRLSCPSAVRLWNYVDHHGSATLGFRLHGVFWAPLQHGWWSHDWEAGQAWESSLGQHMWVVFRFTPG